MVRDKILFAFSEPAYTVEFDHLLRGAEALGLTAKQAPSFAQMEGMTKEQSEALGNLSLLPAFAKIHSAIEKNKEFGSWLASSHPEEKVPTLWEAKEPLSKYISVGY